MDSYYRSPSFLFRDPRIHRGVLSSNGFPGGLRTGLRGDLPDRGGGPDDPPPHLASDRPRRPADSHASDRPHRPADSHASDPPGRPPEQGTVVVDDVRRRVVGAPLRPRVLEVRQEVHQVGQGQQQVRQAVHQVGQGQQQVRKEEQHRRWRRRKRRSDPSRTRVARRRVRTKAATGVSDDGEGQQRRRHRHPKR